MPNPSEIWVDISQLLSRALIFPKTFSDENHSGYTGVLSIIRASKRICKF